MEWKGEGKIKRSGQISITEESIKEIRVEKESHNIQRG